MPDETQQLIAGRYRFERSLGAGAMGQVWRAEDTMLGRAVAVKAVSLGDDEALRARVMREARAAARIDDPGSVRVFDVVDEGHTVYIVMELVEAPTLADLVTDQGPLDPDETARLGLDLLGALAAAHRAGIVHRDVKPHNVMLLPDGRGKLADFGIASVKDDPSITATGMVLGTPKYMSPEQARGEVAGAPADLWSLGALLYFAVEGEAPFDRGETLPTLNAVLHDEPRPVVRAGPLAPTLHALLTKDPVARPGDDATRRMLEEVAGGEPGATVVAAAPAPTTVAPAAVAPLPTPPAQPRPVTTPPVRQSDRGWLAALGVVAAIALLAAIGIGLSQGDDDPPEETATPSSVAAPADAETSTTAEPATTTTAPRTTTTPAPATSGDRPEGVPADWVDFSNDGWTVWHPAAWTARGGPAGSTDLRAPNGDYLRVDTVEDPGPDPVAGWEESEKSFQASHPSYKRLRIEPTNYQGFDAAIWEYTFEGQRAANLGFSDGDRGFALNLVTSQSGWDPATFEAIKAGFSIGED